MEKTIAVIRGDGIGPEIVEQAIAVLDTAAAGTSEALAKARSRTTELLEKLETFAKPGNAEETETARVLREATENLADGKTRALLQNDRTLLRSDGSADLTLEDATFAPDACGHLAWSRWRGPCRTPTCRSAGCTMR